MRRLNYVAAWLLLFGLLIGFLNRSAAAPLPEADLIKLIELGIGDTEVIKQFQQKGLAFGVDDEVLARLKNAGATDAILRAVEEHSTPPSSAITYQDVLKLIELKVSEKAIIERFAKSPTLFTFDAKQEAELRSAGASDRLIKMLQGTLPTPKDKVEITDIAVILDCSGSMKEHTSEGEPKMAVARRVVSDLVANIPDGLGLTFVVYGQDARMKCEAVKVVRSLSELDAAGKSELRSLISGLQPVASTPIALALRTAGMELAKSNGPCGLILISDGKETCNGNPAAEAATLAQNLNLSFGVNVVGFNVKAEERQSLEEIAAAGGGAYFNAGSAAELNEVVGKLKEQIEEVSTTPEQRATRNFTAGGEVVKPGAFFHDAPIVEASQYKGGLRFMQAHYYRIPVHKGQELRAIGIVQKTPYQASNKINNQAFSVTIYDDNLSVAAREEVVISGNPTTPATVRAVWTAKRDAIVYVAIGASDNHHARTRKSNDLYGEKNPKPSEYTLRFRLSSDASADGRIAPRLPLLETQAGSGFNQAGEMLIPGLATTDLKLGEVVFYRLNVTSGESLQVAVAAQKPWYAVRNWYSHENAQATYTVTVYDDDQVQVAQEKLVVSGNQPDAGATSLTWTVELSGAAYVSLNCENSGHDIYPETFDAQPGHLAIQVIRQNAPTATASR